MRDLFFSQKEKKSRRRKCEVVKPGKYLDTHVSNKDLDRIKSPLDNLFLKMAKLRILAFLVEGMQ